MLLTVFVKHIPLEKLIVSQLVEKLGRFVTVLTRDATGPYPHQPSSYILNTCFNIILWLTPFVVLPCGPLRVFRLNFQAFFVSFLRLKWYVQSFGRKIWRGRVIWWCMKAANTLVVQPKVITCRKRFATYSFGTTPLRLIFGTWSWSVWNVDVTVRFTVCSHIWRRTDEL